MFYFPYSINFISENLLPILNIVIATTCSVAHFFRSFLGTAYQLTIALKHTVLQSLMASNSELFFFAHNSGRSAPWAELGLSVHLLGFPQFLMCFTGVGCLRQPQRGCRGSLPCGLSSSRRLAGFFYMVVSGQHPKRVRVEASKLFWALGLRRHHHWSRQFTIPAQIQGEGKGLYKEFVTI